MPTTAEKLASNAAKPVKRRETDHDNLRISRDQFVAKYRKKDEIAAKLELQRIEMEEAAGKEQEALEKIGAQDQKEVSAEE